MDGETKSAIRLTLQAMMIGGEDVGCDRELEVAFNGFGRTDVGLKLRLRDEDGSLRTERSIEHLSPGMGAMAAAQAMVARAAPGGQPLQAAMRGADGDVIGLDVEFQANGIILRVPGGEPVAGLLFNGQVDFSVEDHETWATCTVSADHAASGRDPSVAVGRWDEVEEFLASHGMAMALGEPVLPEVGHSFGMR